MLTISSLTQAHHLKPHTSLLSSAVTLRPAMAIALVLADERFRAIALVLADERFRAAIMKSHAATDGSATSSPT